MKIFPKLNLLLHPVGVTPETSDSVFFDTDLDLLSDFPVSSVDPVSDLPDANKTDEDDLMIETQESPVAIDAPPVDRLSLECPSGSSQESSGGGTVNPLTTASGKMYLMMSDERTSYCFALIK